MEQFRFAVMGAGNIAVKFCDAVNRIEGCEVVAVASRSSRRAQTFAEKNSIPAWYASYEEMLIKERPDCVYIAVLPVDHHRLCMLCLTHGVPVLCEKAMFMDSREAKEVFAISEQRGIFAMEATWSRFLPANVRAKQWLDAGRIGKVAYADTLIGFLAPKDEGNMYHSKALGGGATSHILIYCQEMTRFYLPGPVLDMQVATVYERSGVDYTDHVTLLLPEAIASFTATYGAAVEERAVLYGEEGKIVIPVPHYPSEAFLYDAGGKLVEHFVDTVTTNGFVYEIEETMRCIRAGLFESQVVPHRDTLECAMLFDRIRKE